MYWEQRLNNATNRTDITFWYWDNGYVTHPNNTAPYYPIVFSVNENGKNAVTFGLWPHLQPRMSSSCFFLHFFLFVCLFFLLHYFHCEKMFSFKTYKNYQTAQIVAQNAANETGQLASSAPINLIGETTPAGILGYLPIYVDSNGNAVVSKVINKTTGEEGTLHGMVNPIIKIDLMLKQLLPTLKLTDIDMLLYDSSDDLPTPAYLGKYPIPDIDEYAIVSKKTIDQNSRDFAYVNQMDSTFTAGSRTWLMLEFFIYLFFFLFFYFFFYFFL